MVGGWSLTQSLNDKPRRLCKELGKCVLKKLPMERAVSTLKGGKSRPQYSKPIRSSLLEELEQDPGFLTLPE